MSKVLVGGVQVEPRPTVEETLKRFVELIDEAGRLRFSALCLNDYLLSWPPDPERSRDHIAKEAELIPGPTIDVLARKAKEYGMLICSGSMIEKDKEGRYYNSSTLIGPDGKIIGVHRKLQLLNGGLKLEKDSGISPGTEPHKVYDTPLGKISIIIDTEAYNLKFIEDLVSKGPKLIFWPLSWTVRVTMASYGDQQVTARYMAKKAKAYVISTNKVGLRKSPSGYTWATQITSQNLIDQTPLTQVLYPGGSIIVSKSGSIIGAAEDYMDGIAITAIDNKELR